MDKPVFGGKPVLTIVPGPVEVRLNSLSWILGEIAEERIAQHAKWGEQNLPDGTGEGQNRWRLVDPKSAKSEADFFKQECERKAARGTLTFADVLLEEVYEALAEKHPAALRAELVQVAAVAAQWIEAIDRRGK